MKILAICNLYPPYVMGGNELRLRQILDGLRERHEVHVLSSAPPPEVEVERGETGITRSLRQSVPYPRPIHDMRMGFARECAVSAYNRHVTRKTIALVRPDVVYISDIKRIFLGPAFAATSSGLPIVWDITDTALKHYRRRPEVRRRIPLMDPERLPWHHAIAISDYIRETLIDLDVLDERAVAIRQGVDLEQFPTREPVPRDHKPRKLLFVGSLIPDKGLHVILEALSVLVRDTGEDYRLTVCGTSGDEAYQAQVRKYAKDEGLDDRVIFRGRVPPAETPGVYRDHDIYVFSSVWPEPFATTPLEAMASGVPVVGTPVGGQKGFFVTGENSMVYEAEDPADLAAQVRALEDDELRNGIAERALSQVRTDFGFPTYVEKIEAVLSRAANY